MSAPEMAQMGGRTGRGRLATVLLAPIRAANAYHQSNCRVLACRSVLCAERP